jgi:hypothetical protein
MENMAMRLDFDFSPLYRSTVGFDRLLDMLDQAADVEPVPGWPSYNVEKMGDDHYRVVMAVAGFAPTRSRSSRRTVRCSFRAGNSPGTSRRKSCTGGCPAVLVILGA